MPEIGSDTTAPTFDSLSLSSTTVHLDNGETMVTVTAHFMDDSSGIFDGTFANGIGGSPPQIRFVSTTGQTVDAVFDILSPVSGDRLDGIYQATVTLGAYAEAGTWQAVSLLLSDEAGNASSIYPDESPLLAATTFTVINSQSDVSTPTFDSINLDAATLNLDNGETTITVTVHLLDDVSGIFDGTFADGTGGSSPQVRFVSASGQTVDAVFDILDPVSGDRLDGIYQATVTLGAYAEAGTWQAVSLLLSDEAGNASSIDPDESPLLAATTFTVINSQSDVSAPTFDSIDLSSPTLNIDNGETTITITAHFEDDVSGVFDGTFANGNGGSPPQIRFMSPSGQTVDALFDILNPVSGDRLDGTYQATVTLGPHAEAGTWQVVSFLLSDEAGNERFISPVDSPLLANAAFTVVNSGSEGPNDGPVLDPAPQSASITEGELGVIPPVEISSFSDPQQFANIIDIAREPDGAFSVIWRHEDESQDPEVVRILLDRFGPDGQPLGQSEITLEPGAFITAAATDAEGDLALAVSIFDQASRTLEVRVLGADGTMQGAPIEVFSTTDPQQFPAIIDIVSQPDGTFAVIWRNEDEGQDPEVVQMFVSRFGPDGQPLGAAIEITPEPGAFVTDAATDAEGNLALAVSIFNQSVRTLQVRLVDADGTPQGDPIEVFSTTDMQQFPALVDIARQPDGSFAVVWRNEDESQQPEVVQMFVSRFGPDGTPIGGPLDITPEAGAFVTSIATDAAGDLALAVFKSDQGERTLEVRLLDPGSEHVESGTIAFTDADLNDTHMLSAILLSVTDSADPQASVAERGMFAVTLDNPATGDGSGAVGWTFRIADGALDDLAAGQTITQVYRVTVTDAAGASSSQDVTVTLVGTNDAPTASATGSVAISEDTASAAVAIGATDVDGGPLTYSVQAGSGPSKGSVSFDQSAGTYVYTPDVNANGSDSFTILIDDGNGGTSAQVVSVVIAAVNDAAVIGGTDSGSVSEDGQLTVSGQLTIADVDGAAEQAFQEGTIAGAHGSLALGDAGAWTYTLDNADVAVQALAAGETLTDTVTVRSADGTEHAITITIHGEDDPITNGSGGGLIAGTDGDDLIDAQAGNDIVNAGAGNDTVTGGSGFDLVNAGEGNDTIVAGSGDGSDLYAGGNGSDTLDMSQIAGPVTINLSLSYASSSETGLDLLTSIENAIGGSGNDTLVGNATGNRLDGGAGNDTISAGAAADVIIGGNGNDTMQGAGGQDIFVFAAGFGNDRIDDFDANPAGGQDRIDISAFGITSSDFTARVTISDIGADTLITIDHDPNQTIRLTGIGNATSVTQADFLL